MLLRITDLRSSAGELLLQDIVDDLGIGLAAHRLHHLTDEEAEQFVASAAILRELGGLGGDDLLAGLCDRAFIGNLREPEISDRRFGAFARWYTSLRTPSSPR